MLLAPTDFYAYSRATGVPVPEDPEERAQLAPQVLEFRRNQLKAPQQESNPLNAIGTATLAAGALAGLGFAASRMLGRGRQIPKGPARSATAGVRQANLAELKEVAAADLSQLQQPTPSKLPPSEQQRRQKIYETVVQKPASELPRVYRPSGGIEDLISRRTDPEALQAETLITDPRTGEIFARGKSPATFAQTYEPLDLTSIQATQTPVVSSQQNAAVNSGDNQIINRENLELQRLTDQEKLEEATSSFISQRLNNIARGYGPTRGELRVQMTESQMDAFNRLAGLNAEEALGPIPERALVNIGPEAQITKTAAGSAIRGASPSYQIFTTEDRPRQLSPTARNIPLELGPDVPGSQRATGGYVPQWLSEATAGKPYSLPEGETGPSKQEILYAALDRPRLEAQEVTPGIGVYGVEPAYVPGAQSKVTGEYSEAAYRKPSDVPRYQQKRNPFKGLSDADIIRISESAPPAQAKAMQQQLAARRSVDVSREMTRIMQSYPKEVAQQKLTEYVQNLRGAI
jgi:hypothetical protein